MKSPKQIEEKLNKIRNAWRAEAADKTFGGMTLTQFEAEIAPSFTTRQELADIDAQRERVSNTRNDADEHSLAKADLVTAGVMGDPAFGKNSNLIEAMGYIRESEKKSGLTRKKEPASPPKT